MATADSPASAPRKDFQVARFGANPPRDLVELRQQVTRDIGAACGIPRGLIDSTASGQASAKPGGSLSRHRLTGWRGGIEAQILDQLGVEVAIDSAPLGGRDLLARASVFRRLVEGKLPIADARIAAGI